MKGYLVHINRGNNYGNLAELAFTYKGMEYYVGDIVKCTNSSNGEIAKVVCKMQSGYGVLGWGGIANSVDEYANDIGLKGLIKSYRDLINDEIVDKCLRVVSTDGNKVENTNTILSNKPKNKINAIAYLVFDISGSIDNIRKETYKKIFEHYTNTYKNIILIGHSTSAKIYNSFDDLVKSASGGTYMSSGLAIALSDLLINESNKDNIVVQAGDGDNWSEDNSRTFKAIREINKVAKFVYYEVYPITYATPMYERFIRELKDLELELHKIKNLEDIGNLFKDTKEELSKEDIIKTLNDLENNIIAIKVVIEDLKSKL